MADNPIWSAIKPFVNGGVSGMIATCCIQPIDIVKVRIQLGATGSPIAIASNIVKQEGFFTLYKVSARASLPRLSRAHTHVR